MNDPSLESPAPNRVFRIVLSILSFAFLAFIGLIVFGLITWSIEEREWHQERAVVRAELLDLAEDLQLGMSRDEARAVLAEFGLSDVEFGISDEDGSEEREGLRFWRGTLDSRDTPDVSDAWSISGDWWFLHVHFEDDRIVGLRVRSFDDGQRPLVEDPPPDRIAGPQDITPTPDPTPVSTPIPNP